MQGCYYERRYTDKMMLFNVQKCSVMHMGHGSVKFKYAMGRGKFERLSLRGGEGPIGVVMYSCAKSSRQRGSGK